MGNLEGWVGGIGGGITGGVGGQNAASWVRAALPKSLGTTCFVAGAAVLVREPVDEMDAMAEAGAQPDPRRSLERNWLYAAGAVLVGASLQYNEQRRRKRRQWRREEAIDWCLSEEGKRAI